MSNLAAGVGSPSQQCPRPLSPAPRLDSTRDTMKLKIVSRSGKDLVPGGLEVKDSATTDDLKAAFHKSKRKYYPTRQRFTLPVPPGAPPKTRGTPLTQGKSLSKDYGLADGSIVVFKDLGPQVPYAVVFLAEYAGPMLCYLPFFVMRKEIYGDFLGMKGADKPMHVAQQLACAFHTAHYLKRILEIGRASCRERV